MGFRNVRHGEVVLKAGTSGKVGHQSRGQQGAVLGGVHPPVGEPAFITEAHHVELDIAGRIPTGDEVH